MSISTLAAAILMAGVPVHPNGPLPSVATAVAGSTVREARGDVLTTGTEPPLPIQLLPPTDQAGTEQSPASGEIVVQARRHVPGDPLQTANAKSFAVTQQVDRAVFGPAALAYKHNVPGPIRDGLRNFNNNLREPVVFLNYLLQIKPGKAGETFGRFAVNSTMGGAGLFDVAKRRPFNLPRRPNGFADSFGYYGVKPGPFLFLPLIGPTTLRDLIGGGLDRLVLPLSVGTPFTLLAYNIPTGAISGLDRRAEFDEELQKLRDGTADPYTARRELYLQKRQAEISALHGRRRSVHSPVSEVNLPQIGGDPAASVSPGPPSGDVESDQCQQ